MTRLHISEVKAERDTSGFWTHPAMRMASLETPEELSWWLRAHGLEAWVMLMRDEAPEVFLAGFDSDCLDASGWEPLPPPGDGWFIGSIHDHEDGPVCLWLRDAPQKGGTP